MAQHFGNNRNIFYIELRCNLPCQPGADVCVSCTGKNTVSPQVSRRYDHGKVTEPVPAKSHIYGSEWYLAKVKKYGEPSADVIAMAEEAQKEARPKVVATAVIKKSSPQVSPRTIQTVIQMTTTPQKNHIMTIVKPIIKPSSKQIKVVTSVPSMPSLPSTSSNQITVIPSTQPEEEKKENPLIAKHVEEKPKTPVKRPRPKPKKPSIFSEIKSEPHKDVIIPTYMESTMEVIDMDDYEVEYVKLSVCEINGSTYFKGPSQKIYKKVKDNKPGEYIGRYEAATSCIHTDIPDSDDDDI